MYLETNSENQEQTFPSTPFPSQIIFITKSHKTHRLIAGQQNSVLLSVI